MTTDNNKISFIISKYDIVKTNDKYCLIQKDDKLFWIKKSTMIFKELNSYYVSIPETWNFRVTDLETGEMICMTSHEISMLFNKI